MKTNRKSCSLWQSLLVTSSVAVSINQPQTVIAIPIKTPEKPTNNQQLIPQKIITNQEILTLDQIDYPLIDAQKLVQSQTPTSPTGIVLVTAVKVNTTDKGLEVILETGVNSDSLQIIPKTDGNSYVVDIPNANLRLTNAESFRQEKPVPGISEVIVTNIDTNNIRLTVTGEAGAPTVELFDSDGGLVLAVTPAASTPQLTTPETSQKPIEDNQPIELEVTASPNTSYLFPNTSVGTRTDTPLRDIPYSIQVIPQQVIKDQGGRTIGDIVKNYGLLSVFDTPSQGESFNIRGFSAANNSLRNGLRDNVNRSIVGNAPNNFERIEILRGPAFVLYGQGTPGGTVNYVTKKPLSEPYYSVEFSGGSYSFYKPVIDFSGPLTTDKKLLYRLNASYESSDYFPDFTYGTRLSILPALTWQIGNNTKVTFEAEYQDRKILATPGLPAVGTVLPNPNGQIPLNRYPGEPSKDIVERQTYRLGYDFEHRFSNNWSLQNTFHLLFLRFDQVAPINFALRPDNRTLTRRVQISEGRVWNNYIMDTHVVGKFNTGSIQHQILLGFDLYRDISPVSAPITQNRAALDLFNPVYGGTDGSIITPLPAPNTKTVNDNLGIYAQNQITLTEQLKLVLGGRFDWVKDKSEVTNFQTNRTTITERPDSAFSPILGIVYQPIKPVSLYASYTRSFVQNTGGVTLEGNAFKPSRGTQYEVGVKTDLFDNKLSATLAWYQLTFDNVLTPDLRNTTFNTQTGEQQSQGIEFNIVGEILPGWNVIASYNYTDAKITQDNRFKVGNQLVNVPENFASLWTTYIIPQGAWKGLGFGVGMTYVGDRQGDLNNSFQVPSYVKTDAAIYYRRDNLNVALNLKNLFDVEYIETARSNLQLYPGTPLTVEFTVGWKL